MIARNPAEAFCLQCGLCCNGAIFRKVQLNAAERAQIWQRLSLAPPSRRAGALPQPCPALDGRCCRIYADRPGHCRQFECLVLKRFNAGELSEEAAFTLIRRAVRRFASITRMLDAVAQPIPGEPLQIRFERTLGFLASRPREASSASLAARLAAAMHALNLMLNENFYPDGK